MVAIVTRCLVGKYRVESQTIQAISASVEAGSTTANASAGLEFEHKSARTVRAEAGEERILGAAFDVFHVQKKYGEDRPAIKRHVFVDSVNDERFISFLRGTRIRNMMRLITGFPRTSFGLVTEEYSEMDDHASLQDHIGSMLREEPYSNLALSGWDDAKGVVNLKMTGEGVEAIMPKNRVLGYAPGGKEDNSYEGSLNIIFSGGRGVLDKMYQDIKQNRSVYVRQRRVSAISPAFRVKMDAFLPIRILKKTQNAPSSVVREYKKAVFIVPVEGQEQNKACATVYNPEWEVNESVVRLDRGDVSGIESLRRNGFDEIHDPDGNEANQGKIIMARHLLINAGDIPDESDKVKQDPADGAAAAGGAAASISTQSAVPSLKSAIEDTEVENAQRKKLKTGD